MFKFTKFTHPGYLTHSLRREVAEMYWSTAIADFASAATLLFEPIFLYEVLRFSIAQIIWFFLTVYILYWFLMPLGAKIAAHKGYEHSIFYSTFFQIIYWGLLFGSKAHPALVLFAPLAYAIEKSLFWPAFHADMARFSSLDQRGRENSGLYAIVSIVFILGPFVGGFILEQYGFKVLFAVVSALYLLSIAPLFTTLEKFTPKPYKFSDTLNLYKIFPDRAIGYWGFGEELIELVIWPIFIFIIVPDFFEFGTIISISTLIAVLVMLYVGVLSDKTGKGLLIRSFAALNGVFWAIRSLFPSLAGVSVTNTLGTISKHALIVPITAQTYDFANETHIMPYVVFAEQNLVIGKLLMALFVLFILQFTSNFLYIFILAGLFSLLYANLSRVQK